MLGASAEIEKSRPRWHVGADVMIDMNAPLPVGVSVHADRRVCDRLCRAGLGSWLSICMHARGNDGVMPIALPCLVFTS